MNQNPKDSTQYPILEKSPENTPQVLFYISALRDKYATYNEILDRLDIVAEKIKQVPTHVQKTVAEMLKADLENTTINTAMLTAAIMAINPKNLVQNSANDEKFKLTA